jgi:hypothetical protein
VQFGAFGRTWYLWEEEAKAAQHWRAQTGTVTKHEFHLRDGRALCDLLNRLNA